MAQKAAVEPVANNDDEVVYAYRVVGVAPDFFERALYATSATQQGCFKQAWTMNLLRSGHRCQLPRGFMPKGNNHFFVGRDTRPRQHRDLGQQIAADMKTFAARCFTK